MDNSSCVICLGIITSRGRLPICDHKYCYTCIFQWSKRVNKCPLCKRTFRCITKVSASGSPDRKVRVPDVQDSNESSEDYATLPVVFEVPFSDNSYNLQDSFIDDSFSNSSSSSSSNLSTSSSSSVSSSSSTSLSSSSSSSTTSPYTSSVLSPTLSSLSSSNSSSPTSDSPPSTSPSSHCGDTEDNFSSSDSNYSPKGRNHTLSRRLKTLMTRKMKRSQMASARRNTIIRRWPIILKRRRINNRKY